MIELRASNFTFQAPSYKAGSQLEHSTATLVAADTSIVSPVISYALILAAVLALATGLVLFRRHRRTRKKTKPFNKTYNLGDNIGDIAYSKRLDQVGPVQPEAASQQFATHVFSLASCCTNILNSRKGKSIAISGTQVGNGVTTLSIALARCLAKQGKRTLLIDMNFSRPMAHQTARSACIHGISDYLASSTVEDIVSQDQHSMLDIIGAGSIPSNYLHQFLKHVHVKDSLDSLMEMYERVIIDCASADESDVDVSRIATLCDVRLLVINAQTETHHSEHVQSLLKTHRLWSHGTTLLVRNKVTIKPYQTDSETQFDTLNARVRSIHGEEWILKQPSGLYTLKLTELSYRPILTKRQVSIYAGYQIACFRFTILDRVNYLLILGQFKNREEAMQAASSLGLNQSSVLPVSFFDIKQGIKLERNKLNQAIH